MIFNINAMSMYSLLVLMYNILIVNILKSHFNISYYARFVCVLDSLNESSFKGMYT